MPGEINFSGFNGFDFNQIIDLTIKAESRPLESLQEKESDLRKKDSALGDLGGEVAALQSPIGNLALAGAFTSLAATSTDEKVAAVTLGAGAVGGSYQLLVNQLAKAQVTASTNGFTNATDVAADGGTISFTIGGTSTPDIVIGSTTTLTELKTLINNQNSGVVATVVNDGTNYKLVISSRQSGAANGFTINNNLTNSVNPVVSFAVGQGPNSGNSQDAQDALLTVNGLPISSSSNSVTDAVPGTTVRLLQTGTVSIDVNADYDTLKEQLKTFITEFNSLKEFFGEQTRVDSLTGKPGPLANNSILRQALLDVKNIVLTANGNNGQYKYLTEVGVEFEQDGTLSFDEDKFNTAIGTAVTDVAKLFHGDGVVGGVFNDLKQSLDSLDSKAGLIKTVRDSLDTSLKKIRDQIASQQLRLELRRTELQNMFAAADLAISQLNAQQSALGAFGNAF